MSHADIFVSTPAHVCFIRPVSSGFEVTQRFRRLTGMQSDRERLQEGQGEGTRSYAKMREEREGCREVGNARWWDYDTAWVMVDCRRMDVRQKRKNTSRRKQKTRGGCVQGDN